MRRHASRSLAAAGTAALITLALALPLISAISPADARVGGGMSSGSRGARTFSAPPSTSTAPSAAQPLNRTITQPGSPGVGAPATAGGGFFNSPGRSMLGGLAAGFLGAGLLGMLFGGGMFGGLGGMSSIFGLILQIGLIVVVVRLAMSWWQRRHETGNVLVHSWRKDHPKFDCAAADTDIERNEHWPMKTYQPGRITQVE